MFHDHAGVLYNIRYSIPPVSFHELLQAVVKVLAQVLDVNCFDVINKLLPEPAKVRGNYCFVSVEFHRFFLSQVLPSHLRFSRVMPHQLS